MLLYATHAAAVALGQRAIIHFPTHEAPDAGLEPWRVGGRIMGCCRIAAGRS